MSTGEVVGVRKKLKRLGKEAETISELLFFAGTTVALVVLLSNNVVGNPTVELRGDFESAYAAWCQQWQTQCNVLLVEPQQLLCAVFDETFVYRTSVATLTSDTIVNITSLNPAVPAPSLLTLGVQIFQNVYVCNSETASQTACAFDTTYLADFLTFDPSLVNGTTLASQCASQVNWLANAAIAYNHLYNQCDFPIFSGVYYVCAAAILFAITAAYILQARLHLMDKANDIRSIERLIIYEIIVSPILAVVGVGGVVQSTVFFNCFNVFQFLSLFCFSAFVFLSAIVIEAINIRNLVFTRQLHSTLLREGASSTALRDLSADWEHSQSK